MRTNAWYALFGALGLLWYECGDDFGVFCYRIGCGLFTVARQRAVELAPLAITRTLTRTKAACSRRFFTFSAHYTTPKD
jgi:hypothetical protein